MLQKEGESTKETGVRSAAGGAAGKRAIGKAVAKGGLLLIGKNPGNVGILEIRWKFSFLSSAYGFPCRFNVRKAIHVPEYQLLQISIRKPSPIRKLFARNTSISSCREFSVYAFSLKRLFTLKVNTCGLPFLYST